VLKLTIVSTSPHERNPPFAGCRREAALLADDNRALDALDALDATLAALGKQATRQSERVHSLEKEVARDETEAVAKRRQALRERFAKKLAEADAAATELQAAMANVLALFRKVIAIREDATPGALLFQPLAPRPRADHQTDRAAAR
jgi:hypothetical protein